MKFSSKSFRELKELCEAQKKKNVSKRKSIAYQKQKDQEKSVDHIGQSDNSSIANEVNMKYTCKGCSREFVKSGIMIHLAKKADCGANYSQKEIEDLKTLIQTLIDQRNG